MHARDVLAVAAGDHVAIEQLAFEHSLATCADACNHAVVADIELHVARDRRITPSRGHLAPRVVIVAITPQHEAARTNAGASRDANLGNRKRADRTFWIR